MLISLKTIWGVLTAQLILIAIFLMIMRKIYLSINHFVCLKIPLNKLTSSLRI